MSYTPVNEASGANGAHQLQHRLLEEVVRTPDRRPSPLPTHLSVSGSGTGTPRVIPQEGSGGSGYVAPVFEGKEQQMEAVMDRVEEQGFIPPELVEQEVKWFYFELGIDDMYFATETVDV